MTKKEYAYWLADKIPAYGDYAKEAALVLQRQANEIERLSGLLYSCKNAMIVSTPNTDWTAMIDHIVATVTPNA